MRKLFVILLAGLTFNGFASGHVVTATGSGPCNSLCSWTVSASVTGGVGPFGYTWTDSLSIIGTGQSISGLCNGTYNVTATDSSDMSTSSFTLTLANSFMYVYPLSVSTTLCGACNGAARIGVIGGTGPCTYDWTPGSPSGDGTDSVFNLCIGTYTVVVTDANGCSSGSSTTAVAINSSLTATIDSTSFSSCNSCTGTAQITASGGVAPYTFLWSNGSTGQTTTGLCIGAFSVVVTDQNGCSYTASGSIGSEYVNIYNVNTTPSPCGSCTGTASVDIFGGTGPYTYDWTPGSPAGDGTDSVFNLCIGTYSVIVTDANGCTSGSSSTTVNINGSLQASVDSVGLSNCLACNGTATVNAVGGVPPYTYLWSNGSVAQTATSLCAGSYTVTVTDFNGCSFTTNLYINDLYLSVDSLISSTPTACGVCNGSASILVSGGTGSYIYDWLPGTPTGDGTSAVSNLCAGSYTVMVSDGNGCTIASTNTISVTNNTSLNLLSSETPSDCGMCNGSVSLTGMAGNPPYVYDLNNGSAQQSSGNFTGVCTGSYIVTATDANGCSVSSMIYIGTTNTATFNVLDSIQNETGTGLQDGFIDLTVTGGAPPYTFLWSNAASSEDLYSLDEGVYSVIVIDNNGDCGTYDYYISAYTPGGYINGHLFSDINTNCVFDSVDFSLPSHHVTATNGVDIYYGFTNPAGEYSIWVSPGSYTVSPIDLTSLEGTCVNSYSLTLVDHDTLSGNDFKYVIPPFYDVCVSAYSNGIVPGFNGDYIIDLNNSGSQSSNGVLYFVLPSSLDYISSSPTPSSVSGDTLYWNYAGLVPYGLEYFVVTFNTPVSTPLGSTVTAFVNASVTNGTDINPACNSYSYSRIVSGSFDPNDKTVSPSGFGDAGFIPLTEDEFSYLIRFQNTGNGPAVNINVVDTLSSLLDPVSFQMLNASHPYTVEMLPGNVIKWQFDNIMLPDSNANEAASHGHVQFKINKLNAPIAGQVIENKAYIYFDFNAPVITNTTVNTYSTTADIVDVINDNSEVSVYPNPFNDQTTFVIRSERSNGLYSFEIRDVLGKTVRKLNNITEKQFTVSRNGLENGMYFYTIINNQGLVGKGKVIIK